jgi:hypothetical protein
MGWCEVRKHKKMQKNQIKTGLGKATNEVAKPKVAKEIWNSAKK